MPYDEKEINVNLIRERQHVERIERVARKEGATVESILEAIEQEKADIDTMLYQKPPLMDKE